MATDKIKFIALIMILVFGINILSVQCFADVIETDIVTTSDGYTFNTQTGMITYYSGKGGDIVIPSSINGIKVIGFDKRIFSNCRSLTNVTIPNSVTSISEEAFCNCTGLKDITIPNSVTSIGRSAFLDCSSLTDVIIPDSVTSIGDSAFFICTGLKEVTISKNITSIGKQVFEGCRSLTGVTIPESVTSIGDYAFSACTGLNDITIPESVISIGNDAFSECTGLKDITIPKNVTNIGRNVFSGCSSLINITIPEGVTSIDSSLFSNCTNLTSVNIPDSVEKIDHSAFSNCSSLKSVTIPNSVTEIGMYAFYNCSSLKDITIPSNVKKINSEVFSGCSNLSSIGVSAENEYYSSINGILYDKTQTKLLKYPEGNAAGSYDMPDNVSQIDGGALFGVTKLSSINVGTANKYYSSLNGVLFDKRKMDLLIYPAGKTDTSYKIPNGVEYIGEGAFGKCTNLKDVIVPDGVVLLHSKVFEGCNLTSLTLPKTLVSFDASYDFGDNYKSSLSYCKINTVILEDGVTAIKPFQFISCSFENIIIPNSVTSIGPTAFYGCDSKEITIPNSITSIGDKAFNSCKSLIKVTIPDSVSSIGKEAFAYCDKLQDINIPESVTKIDFNAFTCCRSLTDIIVPGSVVKIARGMFSKCDSLTDVTIQNGISRIDAEVFSECTDLKKITIPDSVTSIGSKAFWHSGLTEINIPKSITSSLHAFEGCSELRKINFQEGVKLIDYSAFRGCVNLREINLPKSVTSIDDFAFSDCVNLNEINISESVTGISRYAFDGCSTLSSINVDASNNEYCSLNGVLFDKACTTLIRVPEGIKANSYNVPNTVLKMYGGFKNCANLESITIPDSVTLICIDVFDGCSKLTSINVDASNAKYSSLNGVLFDKTRSTLIRCPEGITSSYSVPDTVVNIDREGFENCTNLKSIIIPNSVKSISRSFTSRPDLTIIAYMGSCAAEFARSNNINLKYIPTTPVSNPVPEDINGDRAVNMTDVILAASHFNTISSSSNYDVKCDLNNDGAINLTDIMIIAAKFNYKY